MLLTHIPTSLFLLHISMGFHPQGKTGIFTNLDVVVGEEKIDFNVLSKFSRGLVVSRVYLSE